MVNGTDTWADLSDVKIRKTQARRRIALVCASGGAAGIVEIKRGEHTDSDDDLIRQPQRAHWTEPFVRGRPRTVLRGVSPFIETALT